MTASRSCSALFFFNATATTEIYTLSLHDALPIFGQVEGQRLDVPARELDLRARALGADHDRGQELAQLVGVARPQAVAGGHELGAELGERADRAGPEQGDQVVQLAQVVLHRGRGGQEQVAGAQLVMNFQPRVRWLRRRCASSTTTRSKPTWRTRARWREWRAVSSEAMTSGWSPQRPSAPRETTKSSSNFSRSSSAHC